ncbi:phostensin-like [Xyrauchen texanus]|uniref:phostensin-like n=1 Tax=Xyrauchen texanus TaxID=154827 RepID=UPI00224189E1|nr:phostensin-like [Xyrauchen texanus]
MREVTQNQQEKNTLQTLKQFEVTQEVSMTKSSPQLPVPVSRSLLQSAVTEREVRETSRDVSESDIYPRETGRETAHHVESGTFGIWRRPDIDRAYEIQREEELLEEDYLPPSLSPSPPHSHSQDIMSRIYNLKTVSSRTAVCIGERAADIPTHSGKIQGQYNPIRHASSPDIQPETTKLWNHGTDRIGDTKETVDSTGVQMVQHQVERLQLKEQEGECGSHNIRKVQSSIQSSLATEQEVRIPEGQKRPDILRERQKSQTTTTPRFPQAQQKIQRLHPKSEQLRSFTVNAQSTEPSPKPSEQGNNLPSSSSPCTPSPSPSPPLFSIRSASGGPGKRGNTITITPRRPGGASPSGGAPSPSRVVPQGPAPTPASSGTIEAGKKRYPTAEEIEVIGGYQNLERSCLVKSRVTQKAVKVCFDDTQLEKVCEYPSEDCVLASLPCSPHPGPEDMRCGEEQEVEVQDEDDEEESGAFVSRTDMSSVCTGRVRFLKVDESCKR